MRSSGKTSEFLQNMAEILELDEEEVSEELSFEDLAWDSLAVVSTIAAIDEYFDVMISGQSLGECKSMNDVLKLIDSKIN